MSTDGLLKALNDSKRYLDIVQKKELGKSEAEWLIETTVSNFARYYNSGFIEYRKSVAEAGDFAAVEWTGRGATFKDVLGREYIDCLGWFVQPRLGPSQSRGGRSSTIREKSASHAGIAGSSTWHARSLNGRNYSR